MDSFEIIDCIYYFFYIREQIISVDSRTWKDEFIKLVIGQTVLTRYNNKMYRVDDVSFDESPKDKFEKKDGTKVSYLLICI